MGSLGGGSHNMGRTIVLKDKGRVKIRNFGG
jgi:hypothetical protein